MHIQRTQTEVCSPDGAKKFKLIDRLGDLTHANRTARLIKENSKGIQCDLINKNAAKNGEKPNIVVVKADKQV